MAKIENTLPPILTGGTSIHDDLSGLNVGEYIHLTVLEKNKFDNLPNSFAPVDAEKNVNTDWNATSGDEQLLNKPSVFPPSTHTHVEADIIDLDKYTQLETDNLLNNKVDKIIGKGLSEEDYTTVEKSKLSGIEVGATANDTDVNLKNRANHTGTQLTSTISDFVSQVETLISTDLASFKTANFLDFTSSGQTQLDNKVDKVAMLNYDSLTTAVGWSSFSVRVVREYRIGNGLVFVDYLFIGVSNSTIASFTVSTNNVGSQVNSLTAACINNSTNQNNNALLIMNNNSNVVSFNLNHSTANFTASGNKSLRGQFIYKEL